MSVPLEDSEEMEMTEMEDFGCAFTESEEMEMTEAGCVSVESGETEMIEEGEIGCGGEDGSGLGKGLQDLGRFGLGFDFFESVATEARD